MTDDALDPLIHVPTRLKIVATLAALPDGDALSFTRLQGTSPAQLQAKEHGRTVAAGPEAGHHEPRRARSGHPRPRPDASDDDAGGPRAQPRPPGHNWARSHECSWPPAVTHGHSTL